MEASIIGLILILVMAIATQLWFSNRDKQLVIFTFEVAVKCNEWDKCNPNEESSIEWLIPYSKVPYFSFKPITVENSYPKELIDKLYEVQAAKDFNLSESTKKILLKDL